MSARKGCRRPFAGIGLTRTNDRTGAGICAERTALLKAQTLLQPAASSDESRLTGFIRAIAVTSDLPSDPCSPCGICRQFIREFATLDTPILMVWDEWDAKASHGDESAQRGANTHDEKGVVVRTLDELLPLSFGPDKLIK